MKDNSKPASFPISTQPHSARLGATNRLTRALLNTVRQIDRAESRSPSSINERVLSLVALACLLRRNLLPGPIADSIPEKAQIKAFSDAKRLTIDRSRFATSLFQFFSIGFDWLNEEPLIARKGLDLLCKDEFSSLAEDPLIAGWVLQFLSRQPRSKIISSAETNADALGAAPIRSERATAKDVNLAALPALTQWFTPPWIAQFLVRQALQRGSFVGATPSAARISEDPLKTNDACYFSLQENGTTHAAHPGAPIARRLPTLLDPACGAGHILVPALRQLSETLTEEHGLTIHEALTLVLDRCLFGLDIDRRVVELAGLSLYLAVRDFDNQADFPVPNIFYFDRAEDPPAAASIGSLWLGITTPPGNLFLAGPRGRMPLADSPFTGKFSAFVTNPPFLGHRLIPPEIGSFLKTHYPGAHFDLYAAFLALGLRVLEESGNLAVICQQSFMSITRYEDLRRELLNSCDITALVQLGAGAFGHLSGEKLNSAIVVAQKKASLPHSSHNQTHTASACSPIKCWRFLEASEKLSAESFGIESQPHLAVERSQFATISGAAFTFWCPPGIARLFDIHPPLQSEELGITCTNGLFTCNNDLFVANFREVDPQDRVNWVPYDKGGGHKWYRTTPHMLKWGNNGQEIRAYRVKQGQSASLPGERFYFQDGVTYSYIGTKGFRARLLSPGSIFDIASSAVFSERIDLMYILGFLNSALARFLLGLLNPTINFQIGDVRRLPFAKPDSPIYERICAAASEAVEIAKNIEQFDPNSPAFSGAILPDCNNSESSANPHDFYQKYYELIQSLNARELQLQSEIDSCIFALYEISELDKQRILTDPWVLRSERKLAAVPTFQSYLEQLNFPPSLAIPASFEV